MQYRVILQSFGVSSAVVAALALAGCDGKSSAVASRDTRPFAPRSSLVADQDQARDPRDLPVPQVDGKPLWAANRKHTAEENAEYQFTKNGGDFGAANEAAYVTKAHDFIDKPPKGVETLERSNGDKLIYDPKGNVFVVVARNGAPRTMFKPRGGSTYWTQQKDREDKRANGGQDSGGSGQG